MDGRAGDGMGYPRVRPNKLIDDTMGYSRLRASKSTWFSYYQEENGEEGGELQELPNEEGHYAGLEDDLGDYTSPLTEESHLPLSPMEERKIYWSLELCLPHRDLLHKGLEIQNTLYVRFLLSTL